MRQRAISGALVSQPIEITSATVQRGDVIQVGGQAYRVSNLFQLPQGSKQLLFESGELLTMHARTRLVAVRMQRRR
ncbi:hypothetical protein ACFW91_21310 [Streptomyces asoensis]|uniref:hypothetical protein n=1 Tax=Streptomyces asoensis TaxID=249586 RepID=UPI00368D1CE3